MRHRGHCNLHGFHRHPGGQLDLQRGFGGAGIGRPPGAGVFAVAVVRNVALHDGEHVGARELQHHLGAILAVDAQHGRIRQRGHAHAQAQPMRFLRRNAQCGQVSAGGGALPPQLLQRQRLGGRSRHGAGNSHLLGSKARLLHQGLGQIERPQRDA